MISLIAREVGVEDESPLLMVGISESADEEGRNLFFQCDLRRNEYEEASNWPQGESYCVVNENGLTHYGGVREVEFRGDVLRVAFTEGAVDALRLEDSEYEFRLEADAADLVDVRRQLRRILTYGRPEFRPRISNL